MPDQSVPLVVHSCNLMEQNRSRKQPSLDRGRKSLAHKSAGRYELNSSQAPGHVSWSQVLPLQITWCHILLVLDYTSDIIAAETSQMWCSLDCRHDGTSFLKTRELFRGKNGDNKRRSVAEGEKSQRKRYGPGKKKTNTKKRKTQSMTYGWNGRASKQNKSKGNLRLG